MCLFLHPMEVLPAMPAFRLIGDTPERRATRDAMRAGGVKLDLVYPFTLTGRTDVGAFEPALETAAFLGAPLANVLCYDREAGRRADKLAELAQLAGNYGIGLAIEFYPPSQVRSLAEALALLDADTDTHGDGGIGVTLDLLHLVRSGEMPAALPGLGDPRVRIAQLADGPPTMEPERLEWEAGRQRRLPGEGAFDIRAFVGALAPGVPVSVEVPQEDRLIAGVPMLERARLAVGASRRALAHAHL